MGCRKLKYYEKPALPLRVLPENDEVTVIVVYSIRYDNAKVVQGWFTPDPAEQFSNPYLAMGNNPVKYIDPDGQWIGFAIAMTVLIVNSIKSGIQTKDAGSSFLDGFMYSYGTGAANMALTAGVGAAFGAVGSTLSATGEVVKLSLGETILEEAGRAAAHGLVGGTMSYYTGGDFKSGFAAGAVSSGIGSLTYNLNPLLQIGASGISGGLTSELIGGNFGEGFISGVTVSALNHLAHAALLNSAEVTDEKYQGFSDKRKSRYIRKPKTALVQTDERNMVNTITPGGAGVNVQQKDIIRIIGSRVWVKNSLNTFTQTNITSLNMRPLINGWRTATWQVYSYYTSGFYSFQRDINFLLHPSYSNTFDYQNPESYPGGYLSPYMRQFRLGGGFSH